MTFLESPSNFTSGRHSNKTARHLIQQPEPPNSTGYRIPPDSTGHRIPPDSTDLNQMITVSGGPRAGGPQSANQGHSPFETSYYRCLGSIQHGHHQFPYRKLSNTIEKCIDANGSCNFVILYAGRWTIRR